MKIKVDEKKCNGCSMCINFCPMGIITISEGKAKIEVEHCRMCGICARKCPQNAITLK